MEETRSKLDQLDVLLVRALTENPRAGFLELSRIIGVSRATVQARIQRLEASGVITGHGPDLDLPAAGYPVLAFVSLQISQGALDQVARDLVDIPEVLDAYGTSGENDVLCRVAATSHEGLQASLILINQVPSVVRSTSVVALSQVIAPRYVPLLESARRPAPTRVSAYRPGRDDR